MEALDSKVILRMLKRYYLSHVMRPGVHAILMEKVPVQTTLRDGASFCKLTSLIGLKYYHQPSNFVLNIVSPH